VAVDSRLVQWFPASVLKHSLWGHLFSCCVVCSVSAGIAICWPPLCIAVCWPVMIVLYIGKYRYDAECRQINPRELL